MFFFSILSLVFHSLREIRPYILEKKKIVRASLEEKRDLVQVKTVQGDIKDQFELTCSSNSDGRHTGRVIAVVEEEQVWTVHEVEHNMKSRNVDKQ